MLISFVTWYPVYFFKFRWWLTCEWSRRGWTRVCHCSTKCHMWPKRFRMKLVSPVQWKIPGQLDEVRLKTAMEMCQKEVSTSHFLWLIWDSFVSFAISLFVQKEIQTLKETRWKVLALQLLKTEKRLSCGKLNTAMQLYIQLLLCF